MKYNKMLWNGFEEAKSLAERWGISNEFLYELIMYAKTQYNLGANDLAEHMNAEAGKAVRASIREPDSGPAPDFLRMGVSYTTYPVA